VKHPQRRLAISAAAVLLLVCTSCESRQDRLLVNRLRALGLAHMDYQDSDPPKSEDAVWCIGPDSWDELLTETGTWGKDLAKDLPVFQANEVVVHWSYQFRSDKERDYALRVRRADAKDDFSSTEFILAYPKLARSDGGPVLIFDGHTVEMTAEELNEKLKEQGHDSKVPVE
jgi:hypothetical protein